MRVLLLAITIIFCVGISPVNAKKRVALVIGNSAYKHVAELTNPKNDAAAISLKLESLGFKVIKGIDLTHQQFVGKIREFARALRGADIALLFYAGHGLQVNGHNYLAPVETKLLDETDLEFETVRLDVILKQMEREPRTNLVFLDACRNNPLARNLARSMGTRSVGIGRGLAPIESGVGTLISFATQPGNVALDGDGKNSPFTRALVRHIGTPGLDVAVVLRRVRKEVIKSTHGKQVPWENSSLTGSVILKAKPRIKAVPKPDNTVEITYWNSIKNQKGKSYFEAYVQQYPKGLFTRIARLEIRNSEVKFRESALKRRESELKRLESEQNIRDSEMRIRTLEKRLASLEIPRAIPNIVKRAPELLDDKGMALAMQKELNRLGCSVGRPDGVWGRGSRRALDKFGKHVTVKLASLDPSAGMLEMLRKQRGRVCPLNCRKNQKIQNGRCVPKKPRNKVDQRTKDSKKKTARAGSRCPGNATRASYKHMKPTGLSISTGMINKVKHPCGKLIICAERGGGLRDCWWGK